MDLLRKGTKKIGKGIVKGVSAGEKVVSKTIAKGEDLVISKSPTRKGSAVIRSSKAQRTVSHGTNGSGSSRILSGGSSHILRTFSSGSKGGKGRRGKNHIRQAKGAHETDEEVHLFCSDMYSFDFISDAISNVRKEAHVTKLVLEDVILRNDKETTDAVVDLIVNSFYCIHNKESKHLRLWDSITFVDCASDVDTYHQYGKLKENFITMIRKQMAERADAFVELPIRSELKIELHSMLDGLGINRLLQAVERDQIVKAVKFPGFRGNDKAVIDAFKALFDEDEMKLKENTEIYLRFSKKSFAPKDSDAKNPATAVIKQISLELEKMMFSTDSGAFDMSDSSCGEDAIEVRGESHTEISAFDSEAYLPLQVKKLPLETL